MASQIDFLNTWNLYLMPSSSWMPLGTSGNLIWRQKGKEGFVSSFGQKQLNITMQRMNSLMKQAKHWKANTSPVAHVETAETLLFKTMPRQTSEGGSQQNHRQCTDNATWGKVLMFALWLSQNRSLIALLSGDKINTNLSCSLNTPLSNSGKKTSHSKSAMTLVR